MTDQKGPAARWLVYLSIIMGRKHYTKLAKWAPRDANECFLPWTGTPSNPTALVEIQHFASAEQLVGGRGKVYYECAY